MKLIKRALPLLILWSVAGGVRPDTADRQQHCGSASQCPAEKEEAN